MQSYQENKTDHSGSFEAKVALTALCDDKTLAQATQHEGAGLNWVTKRKRQLPELTAKLFDGGASAVKADNKPHIKTPHAKIR